MNKLPLDFIQNKYNLQMRFVSETDAEDIIRLRCNPKTNKFLHQTSTDVEKQRSWIKEYKTRESLGTDYYFCFIYYGKLVGLTRLYHISNESFTFGSWVFDDDLPYYVPIAGAIMTRDLAFIELEKKIEKEVDGTNESNKGVLSFSKMCGMSFDGFRMVEGEKFLTGHLMREEYLRRRERIIKLLPQEQC